MGGGGVGATPRRRSPPLSYSDSTVSTYRKVFGTLFVRVESPSRVAADVSGGMQGVRPHS